jgi:hypothetical protein
MKWLGDDYDDDGDRGSLFPWLGIAMMVIFWVYFFWYVSTH